MGTGQEAWAGQERGQGAGQGKEIGEGTGGGAMARLSSEWAEEYFPNRCSKSLPVGGWDGPAGRTGEHWNAAGGPRGDQKNRLKRFQIRTRMHPNAKKTHVSATKTV